MRSTAEVLFGSARRAVLATLLLHSDESFHLRDLSRRAGVGVGPLHRELTVLVEAGLVRRWQRGRQVFFQANTENPVHTELKSLLIKTSGVVDAVRHKLSKLVHHGLIRCAFVFGSMARGVSSAGSDIDVMIIGDVSFAKVAAALHDAQKTLGREINPAVYSESDFRRKLQAGNPFLRRVMSEMKVYLVGDEDELKAVAGERLAQTAHATTPGDRKSLRRGRKGLARLQGKRHQR